MTTKFTTVEDYMKAQSDEPKQRLQTILDLATSLAPQSTMRISYNMPAVFVGGKILIYVAGYTGHVGVYPGRIATPEYEAIAKRYLSGKSTLKFPNAEPLPLDVIEQFVRLRLQEISS